MMLPLLVRLLCRCSYPTRLKISLPSSTIPNVPELRMACWIGAADTNSSIVSAEEGREGIAGSCPPFLDSNMDEKMLKPRPSLRGLDGRAIGVGDEALRGRSTEDRGRVGDGGADLCGLGVDGVGGEKAWTANGRLASRSLSWELGRWGTTSKLCRFAWARALAGVSGTPLKSVGLGASNLSPPSGVAELRDTGDDGGDADSGSCGVRM